MKTFDIIILILVSIILSSDTITLMAQIKRDGYKLVWRDEFNTKNGSTPQSKYWSSDDREPYMGARQISKSSKVAYINNGKLICKATPNLTEKSDTAEMLTGAITTKGKFSLKYGKVLVRIRTNNLEGNFPAAWLMPCDGGGNPYRYGEIDIFEAFGKDGLAHQTVHNHRTSLGKQENHSSEKSLDVTKWHVYGMEWTSTYIKFSIDGKTTFYYPKSKDNVLLNEGQWTFDRPFYIILNQSIGQKGWHEPDKHKEYKTEFDWIRVYKAI